MKKKILFTILFITSNITYTREHHKVSIDELRQNVFELVMNSLSKVTKLLKECSKKKDFCVTNKTKEYVIISEEIMLLIIDNLEWIQELADKLVDDPSIFSRSDLESIIQETELRLKVINNYVIQKV